MALPNDSITVTPGTGATVATHLAGGKEYQVMMTADPDGHIEGSLPSWAFIVPPVAVGASKIYFDIFNAQAATTLRLRKLFCIVATDVAVAPTVGVRIDHMRTSAVGTSGTAFVTTGTSTSKTAAAFWPFTPGAALPAGITGRVTPSGGATDNCFLFPNYFATEESQVTTGTSSAAASLHPMFNLLPEMPFGQAVELPTGYGLKLVQGTVASAGNLGFFGCFTIE